MAPGRGGARGRASEGGSFEGLSLEGSFEGVSPTWDAVWLKASGEICCIAGACPAELVNPPSCECYAVTVDPEAGTVTVGFGPGLVEGPQEGSEGGLFCHAISFVLFESACLSLPADPEQPIDPEAPVDPEVPTDPEMPVDPEAP